VKKLLLLLAAASGWEFVEVTERAGIRHVATCGSDSEKRYILETLGNGVGVIDYDRDGWPDLFFPTAQPLDPKAASQRSRFYRNQRDGTFRDVSAEAGLDFTGWAQGVCAGDFDNDGFDDLYVTFWGADRLLRNTGEGRFEDVSRAAGLSSETRWSTGCAFLDYDNDGRLDIFVARYVKFDFETIPAKEKGDCRWKGVRVMCGPSGLPGDVNLLLRNEGGGRFRDVSAEAGITKPGPRYGLSVTTIDFDRDGWLDIYVAVDSQASLLYRNNGDGTFTEQAVSAGVAYSEDGREQAGMGSAAADLDGDGRLDLVKTNFIDDVPNVYFAQPDGSFQDRVHAWGLGRQLDFMGWGVATPDFDNDTWPDVLMVNGHVYPELEKLLPRSPYRQRAILYRNESGRRLRDVTAQAGAALAKPRASRGLAVVDFDNNGNVDFVIANMNEPPALIRAPSLGSALILKLEGVRANRSAIGARVTVRTPGRTQVQEVRSGSTFLSQSDLRLHFGLGTAAEADVVIDWPGPARTQERLERLPGGRRITVREGSGVVETTPLVR
jgi:hypothetical protein